MNILTKVLKLLYITKLIHLTMSDGQIVTKKLEDFQGALDEAIVVGSTINDQQFMLLLATLPNFWHAFVMTQGQTFPLLT